MPADPHPPTEALVCTSCDDETHWLSARGLCDHCETQAERDDPATEAPDLTWDHELSRWVPAYRQTRWDPAAAEATTSASLDQPGTGAGYTAVEPHCRCTDPACAKVTHYYGDPVPPAGPGLDPLERRITAAILSAYLVPPDVLPAMVERVARALSTCATGRGYRLHDERFHLARAALSSVAADLYERGREDGRGDLIWHEERVRRECAATVHGTISAVAEMGESPEVAVSDLWAKAEEWAGQEET